MNGVKTCGFIGGEPQHFLSDDLQAAFFDFGNDFAADAAKKGFGLDH